MRLVTYENGESADSARSGGAVVGTRRGGLLVDSTIIDLERGFAWLERMRGGEARAIDAAIHGGVLAFVEHTDLARPRADALLQAHAKGDLPDELSVALADVKLASPIPRPPSMRDGYAFRQHVETARKNRGLEMIPEFDQFPVFYFTNHQAVIGPGDLRVRDKQLDRLDFELEAAIVIGKECRDVRAADADHFIFGMTIMNDWSARALQMDEMKLSLGPAKGKDFATGLGPWLVSLDDAELAPRTKKTENGNVYDLPMRAFVNGKQLSTGNVKDMTWTFGQIIERASYGVTLYPGDVIGSGTCGTGCFLELNGSKVTSNQWLRDGDRVALEIDGLGRLENKVVRAEPA
jgi:fumarylacetoacetate (FAA) hydrolase